MIVASMPFCLMRQLFQGFLHIRSTKYFGFLSRKELLNTQSYILYLFLAMSTCTYILSYNFLFLLFSDPSSKRSKRSAFSLKRKTNSSGEYSYNEYRILYSTGSVILYYDHVHIAWVLYSVEHTCRCVRADPWQNFIK